MDQRTDTEHRLDAAPGHDINPAIGEARKTQPWLDRMRRRRRQVLVITALIIAAIVGTVAYWLNASGYESTDDAFIDARTVSISAQVGAAIVDVPVTDNQLVEAGAVLLRLDDRDYRAQADQAKAQMSQAQASITSVDAEGGSAIFTRSRLLFSRYSRGPEETAPSASACRSRPGRAELPARRDAAT